MPRSICYRWARESRKLNASRVCGSIGYTDVDNSGYGYERIQDDGAVYLWEVTNLTTNEKHYMAHERIIEVGKERRDMYPFEELIIENSVTTKEWKSAGVMWAKLRDEIELMRSRKDIRGGFSKF